MIVRLSLFLFVAAVAGFLLAITVEQTSLFNIAERTTQLASLLLLTAFCLLVLLGLAQISRLILASLRNYFSQNQHRERKLLYYLNKYNSLSRLFQLQKDRILYDNQQQRKRLLRQSNGKSATS